MEKKPNVNILIRVPPELHMKFKLHSAKEKKSMQRMLIAYIQQVTKSS